jgi:N-acetylmuramoyl-L-alanine amidase
VRGTAAFFLAILVLLPASLPQAQGTAPATPLSLLSREGRRPVPTIVLGGQELIALDEVAALFQVTVREDTLAGGLTMTYKGRTIVVSTDQPMASVSGRVVALPSPAVRSGNRWFVPLEFLPRALAPIYDARIDLRRVSRLLVVGDLRVPRVTGRIDSPGPPTRAILEIAPAAPVSVTTEAGRILVRVDADALDAALPADGAGLIEQMRQGDQPTTVAVVLASRAGAARAVPVQADGITRVTIEVAGVAAPTATAAASPAVAPPAGAGVGTGAAPLLTGSRAPLQTIVIDPGHGGVDVGARGGRGAEEKGLTLDVARRLRTLIEMRLGVRVILTREDDRAVSLDERAALANNSKADLFLSLHLNAAPVRDVAGAEVFHVRLDREGEDARRAAESDAVSLSVLGGAVRTIDVIRWDLAQARHVEASAVFAGILEEDLRAQVMMSRRPRQEAPLRGLTGVNMPAALIEMAYLTNAEQEQLAQSEAYQSSLAQAMYNAVVGFRSYLEEQGAP